MASLSKTTFDDGSLALGPAPDDDALAALCPAPAELSMICGPALRCSRQHCLQHCEL